MKQDYAVIVGVEHYKPGGLNPLPGATNDADDFYEWIISADGGNLSPDNCKLLKSKTELTAVLLSQIEDEINAKCVAAKGSEGGRRFYFFFSGHGLGVNPTETALIPTNWVEGLPRALATDGWKQSILERGAFEEVLFFLDCCRSRKVNFLPSSKGLYNARPAENVEDFNEMMAQATSYLDPAFEAEFNDQAGARKNGFFTTALLRGLKGEAADETGLITFEGLKDYLENETTLVAQQFNKKQKARVKYSHGADTVFIKVEKNISENVKIILLTPENGPFIIENGDFEEVATYQETEREWNLTLPNGLYSIRDNQGKEKLFRVRIKPKTSIDVEF